MTRALDLSGQKFGRMTALELRYITIGAERVRAWKCKCDCGTIKTVRQQHLTCGATTSCGCLRNERVRASNSRRRSYRPSAITAKFSDDLEEGDLL